MWRSIISTACAFSRGPLPRIRRWRRRKRCSIRRRGYDDAPWLWSDQYDRNIQILGIPQPGSRTIVRDEPQGADLLLRMPMDA
jgi:hypothetical protein